MKVKQLKTSKMGGETPQNDINKISRENWALMENFDPQRNHGRGNVGAEGMGTTADASSSVEPSSKSRSGNMTRNELDEILSPPKASQKDIEEKAVADSNFERIGIFQAP